MTATSPEQVIQQFSLYLSDGNLEGALALYEPNATFVFQPGEVVHGLDAIRSALAGFVLTAWYADEARLFGLALGRTGA